jgi:hypothetical protein
LNCTDLDRALERAAYRYAYHAALAAKSASYEELEAGLMPKLEGAIEELRRGAREGFDDGSPETLERRQYQRDEQRRRDDYEATRPLPRIVPAY